MDFTTSAREIWECYIASDFETALTKTKGLVRMLSPRPDEVISTLRDIILEARSGDDFAWALRLLGSDCFRQWGHERDPKMLFGLINDYGYYNQTADKLDIKLLCELMREGGAEYTLKVILWSRARETHMSEWSLDRGITVGDYSSRTKAEWEKAARLWAGGHAFIAGNQPTAQVYVWNYLAFLHRAFLRLASPRTFANTWMGYGDSWHRAASEFSAHPELATQNTSHKDMIESVFDAYACIADVNHYDVMSPVAAWRRIAGYIGGGGNYLVPHSVVRALALNTSGYDPLSTWAKKLLDQDHKVEDGFIRCWGWNTNLS